MCKKGSWDFMRGVCFCHGMECGEINGGRVSVDGGGRDCEWRGKLG